VIKETKQAKDKNTIAVLTTELSHQNFFNMQLKLIICLGIFEKNQSPPPS
jgi:hypothetical protein